MLDVSIRRWPEGQRKHRLFFPDSRLALRFNPPPARRPAETWSRTVNLPSAMKFQSAAGPKASGNVRHLPQPLGHVAFQSAAGPKASGNGERIDLHAKGHLFQSAAGPKASGNRIEAAVKACTCQFQSAAGPKASGNGQTHPAFPRFVPVSIRRRPEGQRKPPIGVATINCFQFQSAAGPKASGNAAKQPVTSGLDVSNPPPARRPAETPGQLARLGD